MNLPKQMPFIALLLSLLSCDSTPKVNNNIVNETLEADQSELFFDSATFERNVGVTTTFDTIEVDVSEDWCNATLNTGNTVLTVRVEALAAVSRTAAITLTAAKNKSTTITVTQAGHGETGPVIEFGLIADIQYADKANTGRYYRMSLEKLEEAVEAFNGKAVQFTVNLGDLIDEDAFNNLDEVLTRLDRLDSIVYTTTGNHDYADVSDNDALYAQLGMPAEYYSFTAPGWRFIMLNTNEISEYTNLTAGEWAEFAQMRLKMQETGRRYAPYNGGISKKQMAWMEEELKKSVRESVNTIVFSHHPLYGPTGLTALNDVEIVALLSKYASTVKAAIAGHHHSGHYASHNGIPFITVEGVVENTTNAYATVAISPEKIEIKGVGRTRSHTIRLE